MGTNLDVRLTRSQSGNILDIDFVGGLTGGPSAAPAAAAPAASSNHTAEAPACSSSTAVVLSGRKLKILEHRVHKVEMRTKDNGESEEELVVSNLRPFTLKVGVHDALDMPILDCSLPLRAALLYENGLPVKQTSSSEPLLVGETDVVALQGAATFKLRITSLSSHRDKQRFRIQVAPQEEELQRSEPQLCVVTDPMKSVTKLGRSSNPTMPSVAAPLELNGVEGLKRKYREVLDVQAQQIQHLQNTQQLILRELLSVTTLAQRLLDSPAGRCTDGMTFGEKSNRSTT
mmetsp:Transcript_73137/g.122115  ORF Transcript_73137/g.122115 Transcript_73137/m.122115 type:complete len:288 (-) Transcript_73137:464-1327(-)|eukprot:CAMPEP_0119304912 /NCGR_PEP_ID=MMETSP1333-20130426/6027_1 /TAXON_ID=418940 /ORGANISM="Scyphosphaera apsteinii, Strain RCC1455" /LENGTH=287 /DNA_ID=CAMNT_0007307879 /DNA_START=45 /DNA_END=908 /DNA_ORIENTATION=-